MGNGFKKKYKNDIPLKSLLFLNHFRTHCTQVLPFRKKARYSILETFSSPHVMVYTFQT